MSDQNALSALLQAKQGGSDAAKLNENDAKYPQIFDKSRFGEIRQLYKLGMGIDNKYHLGKINDIDVYLRPLTVFENLIVNDLSLNVVDELYPNTRSESKATYGFTIASVIRLLIASCTEQYYKPTTFETLIAHSKLNYRELLGLIPSQLHFLQKIQFEIENQANPELQECNPDEVREAIERLKKRQILPRDLNWVYTTHILNVLIQDIAPEAK